MDDVGQELTARGEFLPWLYSQNQPFYDLVYADDTALIAGTAQRAEQLLHILQRVAAHSNLHLNRKKCVLLRSPTSHNTANFSQTAPHSQSNNTPNILALHSAATVPLTASQDVLTRVTKARKHFNSLHQFWRNTDLTLKWKLPIYNGAPLLTCTRDPCPACTRRLCLTCTRNVGNLRRAEVSCACRVPGNALTLPLRNS